MKRIFFRGRFVFIPLAAAAFLSLISYVVMELWNNILPLVLHVSAITFWQAMGIFVLCKILFGFHKGGGHRGGGWKRHMMQERFKNMSPEDREKFKAKWEQHCGHGHRWGGRGWDDKRSFFREPWGNAEEQDRPAQPTE